MKKIFPVILTILFTGASYGQVTISGGMGVNYTGSSSFIDYLDRHYASVNEGLNDGYTSVEFFIEGAYDLNEKLTVGLDYAYRYYSYNSTRYFFNYEMSYDVHSPSVVLYYPVKGKGYRFYFGGGAGVRFASLKESAELGLSKKNYSSVGAGILLKAAGHTALSEHFYAVISGTVKFDYYGKIQSETINDEFDLTSISAGVNLGVSYYF